MIDRQSGDDPAANSYIGVPGAEVALNRVNGLPPMRQAAPLCLNGNRLRDCALDGMASNAQRQHCGKMCASSINSTFHGTYRTGARPGRFEI
jgi:hypothetical protein